MGLSSRTINCGQMCISPDYVLCHEDKMDEFVKAIKETATKWFSTKEDCDKCVGKIVSSQQFDRVTKMIKDTKGEIIFGGDFDEKTSYIQPTVIRVNDWEDYGMKEETFGPVLWIAPAIKNVQQAVDYINTREKSLSLYMFSENAKNQSFVINNTSAGAVQVNGTSGYIANDNVGFGGVGASGMGQYHGDKTFEIFSHNKPVCKSIGENKTTYPPRQVNIDWLLKYV